LDASAANSLEYDVDRNPAGEIATRLELGEEPSRDTRPDHQLTTVGIALAGKQPEQLALARSVRSEHADPLAEVDLLRER